MTKEQREMYKATQEQLKSQTKNIYDTYKEATGSKKNEDGSVGSMTTAGKVIAGIGLGILALIGLGS